MNSKIFYTLLVVALLGAVYPVVESKNVMFFNSQGTVGKSYILNGRSVDCPKGQQRDFRNACRPLSRFRRRRKGSKKPTRS